MTYKFVINSTEVGDPGKWDSLELSIKRDSENKGLTVVQTATLEFAGDGYTLLKNEYETNGWNKRLTLTIYEESEGDYRIYWNGLIFLSDITFDLKKGIAKVKVQDNSFYAMIDNNKSIGINMAASQSGLSKNNAAIEICAFEEVDFFSCETGAYNHPNVWCVRAHDMLRYMVAFMSDGEIGFRSDCFNTGGEHAGSYLTTGLSIALNNTTIDLQNFASKISFQDVLKSLTTIVNLGWWIETDNGHPVFRVEPESFFYNSTIITDVVNVDSIEQSTSIDRLYSKINIGSSDTLEDSTYTFPEGIALNGFSSEEYVLQSVTNVDNALDLTYNLITSSNVIEAVIGNTGNDPDTTYDAGWFLIDVDIDTMQAVQGNWLGLSAGQYYNEKFTNNNIITRSLGGIPNDIVNFLTSNTALFKASKNADQNIATAVPTLFEPIPFQNDSSGGNHDNGNHWDETTDYDYTADIAGIYTFRTTLIINDLAVIQQSFDVIFKVYDQQGLAGGNLYDSFINTVTINNGMQTIVIEQSCFMLSGYRMILAFDVGTPFAFSVLTGSSIECIESTNGSGIISTVDTADFQALSYTFNQAISKTQQLALIASPNKLIRFDDGNNFLRGFIEEVKVNNLTGRTQFKLSYAKKNNLPAPVHVCEPPMAIQILFGLQNGASTVTIGLDAGTMYYVYITAAEVYSGVSDGTPLVINLNLIGSVYSSYVKTNYPVRSFQVTFADINSLDITAATEIESVIVPGGGLILDLDISNNSQLLYLDLGNNGMTDTAVNSILIALDNFGNSNGTCIVNNQTPAAPPTGSGITAKANLISKGWTVTTD